MTTEQTEPTRQPSVEITTNAKGHAQVKVKVYGAPYTRDIRVDAEANNVLVIPTPLEELPELLNELTTIAAKAKFDLEAKIRAQDGIVAGDV